MKHYCAYQERCQQEVYQKMRAASLTAEEASTIISRLIEENYLNEERFARQFAGGYFRMKKWGKQKIVFALQQKQISDYCIRKAMEEIDDDAYTKALHKLARAKWAAISTGTPAQRWAKTKLFLLQKGYQGNEVQAVLQQLQRGDLEE